MRTNYSHLFLTLSVTIMLIVMPVNAREVSVTFDEGRLCAGQEIGNTYSDQGITFSPGVKLIDIGYLSSEKDMGFWNPDNRITQIYFSPAVISVSIDFENALAGNMDALLVNGEVLSKSEYNCEWTSKNTLRIESNNANIQSISISSKLPCSRKIKFDNLCYEQVTGISENSSCGNNENSDNTDNEDYENKKEKTSAGNNKNSDYTGNENCMEEEDETSPGNDTNSDNADNEDCDEEIEETPCEEDSKSDNTCPDIPESSPCENDTEPADTCPDVPENSPCESETPDNPCNQEIPEYPTIALPMVTVLGMIFMFQRRQS